MDEQKDMTMELYELLVEDAIGTNLDDGEVMKHKIDNIVKLGSMINDSNKIENDFYIENAKVVASEKELDALKEHKEVEFGIKKEELAVTRAGQELESKSKDIELIVEAAGVVLSIAKLITFAVSYKAGLDFDRVAIHTSDTAKSCKNQMFKLC